MSTAVDEILKELGKVKAKVRVTEDDHLHISPRSLINEKLAKLIKKHKPELIDRLRWLEEHTCRHCDLPIRETEPYLCVEDLETGQRISYHVDYVCQKAGAEAQAAIFLSHLQREEAPPSLVIHHMHACDDPNPDVACSEGCFGIWSRMEEAA